MTFSGRAFLTAYLHQRQEILPYQIQVYRVTDLQHSSVSLSAGSTVAGGVAAINMPRLQQCDADWRSVPRNQPDRLQSVMNAAARLVCSARKSDHITPLLRDLHCMLRVPQRIEFKLAVLVSRCLHGMALPHPARELCPLTSSCRHC